MKRFLAAFAAAVGVAVIAVGAVSAAPKQPQPFSCDGLGDIQIVTPPAHGSDQNWGVAQIVSGGHLIPVSFDFSAYDNTVDMPLFDSGTVVKAGGNGNHNQPTTNCSFSQSGPLSSFLQPGDEVPPPPFALTDDVTFTITATVVAK